MDVKLNVRSVHFDADQKLIDFIQEKINKLSQYFDKIIDADVYLKLENVSNLENKTVEIRVNIPGNDLFAKKTSKSFEESTDEVTEALRRQIKRHKEKVRG
ncbi:ribosome hibernation-promoting factor, HPF/YfiA family [Acidiluteibacter ferrifornacis]|jgi:ribosome hibernation promoting factor|uniref:Ribosome-associated translation inhibitor RaiA n=1 Tax=Acidiluteibacter ferrifornacis TaxID=2692424 RepID=A0A6N9NN11_9FLAO|nr:ribosome-associated translation inhibitor RaiA [Acidiluteibacter ferrifornacis]MBR9832617.1 ribosome-associated translation inhibitor RaiA [bacterium]NBG66600.1 ribosome-associated translation inhibitor RaiA [Acidiluteibacter ferrifornacis]|tara:strand:+ start:324 stop:626 length:303 start_codon:yes stop_codon:yes gene_type:complete